MRRVLIVLIVAALPLLAGVPLPPAPTRYVTDAAGVLPDDREQALNEKLAQFERDTTNQVIVYVDRKVPEGTTLEEMGAEAIKTWAVGQAKKDNGAILFLFIDERKSRIEVGYGLEGTLTDARSKRILVGMRDALRAGDYAGAVEAGANGILATIREPGQPLPVKKASHAIPVVLFIVFIGLLGLGFVALVVFFVIKNWKSSSTGTSDWSSSSSSSDWSGSSSSDSSSSSSSSDFSGGGGSGGGGGASDSW